MGVFSFEPLIAAMVFFRHFLGIRGLLVLLDTCCKMHRLKAHRIGLYDASLDIFFGSFAERSPLSVSTRPIKISSL